jgi:hypothetical protein
MSNCESSVYVAWSYNLTYWNTRSEVKHKRISREALAAGTHGDQSVCRLGWELPSPLTTCPMESPNGRNRERERWMRSFFQLGRLCYWCVSLMLLLGSTCAVVLLFISFFFAFYPPFILFLLSSVPSLLYFPFCLRFSFLFFCSNFSLFIPFFVPHLIFVYSVLLSAGLL